MNGAFWKEERIAGAVLIVPMILMVIALLITIASGAIAGFGAKVSGQLAEAAPYESGFRTPTLLFVISWLVQLLGLCLLTRLLVRAGAGQLVIPALALIAFAVIVAFTYYSFRMTVEPWAAQEAARTGGVPEFFEPVKDWLGGNFELGYRVHFLAMIGYGVAVLRTRLLAPGASQGVIGWTTLWFVASLFGVGIPALPFFAPAFIGIVLLLK
jgi:hypothetical protein